MKRKNRRRPIASFITLSALCLFFISDLHLEVFRALLSSYSAIPVDGIFQPATAMVNLTDTLSKAFLSTIRIAAPFIVFAVVVNIAVGLINKLTPSIPVYFISIALRPRRRADAALFQHARPVCGFSAMRLAPI